MKHLPVAALLLIFVLGEWVFDDFVAEWGMWSNYAFELLFCGLTALVLRVRPTLNLDFGRKGLLAFISLLVAGVLLHFVARRADFLIPFDLSDPLAVILLLAIAPILEELLLRFALWECVARFVRNARVQVFVSAAIFSFSHLFFVWRTLPDLHPFLYYQTLYSFFLGWACAQARQNTGGVGAPILLHFAFNLGFYLGR